MPEPTPHPGLDTFPRWQLTAIALGLFVLTGTGDWIPQTLFLASIAAAVVMERRRG